MKLKKLSAAGRACVIVGALFLAAGIVFFLIPLFIGRLNAGAFFGFAACLAAAVLLRLHAVPEKSRILRRILAVCTALGAAALSYFAALTFNIYGAAGNSPQIYVTASGGAEEAPPMIVFGCLAIGDKPSYMLEGRLEAAAEYLKTYPTAICVVSGGKGENEQYAEADVMKKYLLEKEIEEKRIIIENKSTSTYENLGYSLGILREAGIDTSHIVVCSDDFHIYRITLMAEHFGSSCTAVASRRSGFFYPMYTVREWLTVSAWYLGFYNK